MTSRRLLKAAAGLFLAGVLAATVRAREAQTPASVRDLPVHLDFEQDVDADNFPDEWVLVVGRRHPQDIRVKLDEGERRAGKRSFLMELDGVANVCETRETYRLDPRFSHRLVGYIRTSDVPAEGMRKTFARLELVGVTSDMRTAGWCGATAGVTGTTGWTRVSLEVPRDLTRTFGLVRIRCVIDGTAVGGRVWFDEITLAPRPVLHVAAGRPEGFFSPDDAPRASVSLDTLTGEDYRLSAKLMDPAGRTVMTRSDVVTPGPGFTADVSLALPLDAFGPYLLRLELSSAGGPVLSLTKPLIHWPGAAGGRVSPDFGVYAGGLGGLGADRTEMLIESGFGTIGLDLFAGADGADDVTTLALRAAPRIGQLRRQRIEPVAVLGVVPRKLVGTLFRESQVLSAAQATWLRVLSLDADYGSPFIALVPSVLTARTACWQIGERADHSVAPEELARAVSRLRTVLTPLTYRPRIGVVFDGTETPETVEAAAGCDFIVLDRSGRTDAAAELPELVRRLKRKVGEVWVTLAVPCEDGGASGGSEKLVEAMIRARAAGADRVNLRPLEGGLLDEDGNPRRILSAAATLARELGGKRCVGTPAADGRAFLFVGPTGSRLAVLPTSSSPPGLVCPGRQPRKIDLDGNVSPLAAPDLSSRAVRLVTAPRHP